MKDTKHWKLRLNVSWVEKPIEQLKCTTCAGTGKKYNHPFQTAMMMPDEYDQNERCDECFGRGTVDAERREPRPAVPNDIWEAMEQAWCKVNGIWKLPAKTRN